MARGNPLPFQRGSFPAIVRASTRARTARVVHSRCVLQENRPGCYLASSSLSRSLEWRVVGPNSSCIFGATGGADRLLTWMADDVLKAVLAEIGMDVADVAIAGGSLGGLTSCHASSAAVKKNTARKRAGGRAAAVMSWSHAFPSFAACGPHTLWGRSVRRGQGGGTEPTWSPLTR